MDGDISTAVVSDLIGCIYDCALDPQRWPDTLALLKSALGFAHATLSLQSLPTGRVLLNVTSGIPSPWLERIPDYGSDIIALWGGNNVIASAPLEEPLLLSEMNPEIADGSSRNRYYLEWRRPQGLIDTVAIGLARDAYFLSTASLVRQANEGPVQARELDAIRLLAPHLRRAVTISRLLDIQSATAATFGAVVDACGVPIVVVDADRRILHANGAAAALEEGFPLARRGGIVRVGEPTADRALAMAVTQAAADESMIGRRGLAIPVRQSDGVLHVLHVLPLARRASRPIPASDAAAAIFVASTATQHNPIGKVLAALFDLTPAEVGVFDLVAQGRSVSEVAVMLGIGVSTVRTHLARLFEKTGVSRQVDLVRMATTLSGPASGARAR